MRHRGTQLIDFTIDLNVLQAIRNNLIILSNTAHETKCDNKGPGGNTHFDFIRVKIDL
jgi:hypothetical protein